MTNPLSHMVVRPAREGRTFSDEDMRRIVEELWRIAELYAIE
jgi:hypothetical protein